MKNKQIALIVLDGWGYRDENKDNAIASSKKPFFDYLWNEYPHSLLEASGTAVGLPEGQIGNSEVGHMTIGAGKIIDTDLVRINKSLKSGEFSNNNSFNLLFDHVKNNNSNLHILGLLSPGGIHSDMAHLFAFLDVAKNNNVKNIFIHVFTDGRDVPPQSANKYIKDLEDKLYTLGIGKIISISGRLYSMDRDNNWDRTNLVSKIIFEGQGEKIEKKASLYVKELYEENIFDEHIKPVICLENNNYDITHISKNDGVFFFNFRADRSRQLSKIILEKQAELNLFFVTMTNYGDLYKSRVAFPIINIETSLTKEISRLGLKQAHIAETEKFAHATYFLNGGVEVPYDGEEDILIQSHKDVLTHDLAPKMRAKEIADEAIRQIEKGTDFIFINFANADMVGHTANVLAIIEGVEEIDRQLKRVIDSLNKNNGVAFITADHGNAEINIDQETGEKHTAHTLEPVPFIVTNFDFKLRNGNLADVTPTIFAFMNIIKPESMTGESLII